MLKNKLKDRANKMDEKDNGSRERMLEDMEVEDLEKEGVDFLLGLLSPEKEKEGGDLNKDKSGENQTVLSEIAKRNTLSDFVDRNAEQLSNMKK
jgi:hypothetical protein